MEGKISSPPSRRWGLPLLSCLIGLVVGIFDYTDQYDSEQGLNQADGILSLDLAQVASRVAGGRGFVTGFVRPLSLRFQGSFFHHPELTHPPLYILWLAAGIKLAGARDITLVAISIFFFWACVPLIWFFSYKFFNGPVAALALFLHLSNPILLRHSLNGGPATFSAFLVLLFLYCLYRSRVSSSWWLLAAGAVAGGGYLTRYSYGLWLAAGILFVFLGWRTGRARAIGLLLAGGVMAAAPWLIRNLVVSGNPFFTLQGLKAFMFSDPRPGYILWRGFSAQSILVPRKFFFALKKLLLGVREQYLNILLLTGNFSTVFALTAVLHRFEDRIFDRLKYVLYAMILLESGCYSLYYPDWNGLVAFIPGALIIGSAFFLRLTAGLKKRGVWGRGGAVALFLVLCFIPLAARWGPGSVPLPPLYNLENIRSISSSVPPDSLLVSDVPWAVAWYGKGASLWLPYRIEDYEEIRIYYDPPVSGFYLTRFYFSPYFSSLERSPDWERVYRTGWIPGGWEMKNKGFLPGNQIFISREPYL